MSWMTPEQRAKVHRRILYIRAHDPIAPRWFFWFVHLSTWAMTGALVIFAGLVVVAILL